MERVLSRSTSKTHTVHVYKLSRDLANNTTTRTAFQNCLPPTLHWLKIPARHDILSWSLVVTRFITSAVERPLIRVAPDAEQPQCTASHARRGAASIRLLHRLLTVRRATHTPRPRVREGRRMDLECTRRFGAASEPAGTAHRSQTDKDTLVDRLISGARSTVC